jgi:predicted GNAT family acetyltransferase
MVPPVEVRHVPPVGSIPGKFFARVDSDGTHDEDGEPNHEAYVAYEIVGGGELMVMFHTFTPVALRGKGLAARVCEVAFAWAEENGKRVVPACSYVSDTFLANRQDLTRVVDAGEGR